MLYISHERAVSEFITEKDELLVCRGVAKDMRQGSSSVVWIGKSTMILVRLKEGLGLVSD
jgi:hypothetical protein